MKEYDKEKLNEYAKELFALCLEKGLRIEYNPQVEQITIYICFKDDIEYIGYSYIKETSFKFSSGHLMPIWELIEKVKQL